MRIKSQPFTLIELIVSMALMTALLSTLGFFYSALSEMDRKGKMLEQESLAKLFLENRLFQILPAAASFHDLKFDPKKEAKSDFYFFTAPYQGHPSLVFVFDNDVDINPLFSGNVLARLFVDEMKQLCLGMWPLPSKIVKEGAPPFRKEILLRDVVSFNLSFLVPKSVDLERVWKDITDFRKGRKVPPLPLVAGSWVDEWSQSYEQLPPVVKIAIEYGEKDLKKNVIFILPLGRSESMPAFETHQGA